MALEGPGQNCLDKALTTFENFFSVSVTEAEVDAAWNCTSESLKMFKTHVRGQNPDLFTAFELRAFIERYFLTNRKISDPLLTEVMRLKQAVLGGELERLTRDELDQADVVLNTMRLETVKLVPYMNLFTLRAVANDLRDRPEFVERGLSQLVGSASVLGSLMGRSKSPYKLKDAENLSKEFGKLYTKSSEWKGPNSFVSYLPTVAALKAFFIRPNGDAIAPNEWPDLVAHAGRLYALYLRYKYLISDKSLSTGEGLRQITMLAKDFFMITEGSVKAKEGEVIRFREIDGLIEQIYKIGVPEIPVKEATTKEVVRHVLEKIYSPAKNDRRYRVDGISLGTLEYMKQDFFGWSEVQQAWSHMAGPLSDLTLEQARKRLKALKFVYDSSEEMKHLFDRPYPLAFTSKGTVIFEPAANFQYDQEVWTSLNWKRLFVRLALRGYASDFESERFIGLRKANFKELFDDLRPFALEQGMLDPRNPLIWDSTFDEANVFLFSADGNDRLSFAEGVEVLSFVLSGSKMSGPAYEDMRANCKNFELDIFGLPMVDVHCYRERLRSRFDKYYFWMPGWGNLVKTIPDDKYPDFQSSIETASRVTGYKDTHMESADIDKMSMVLQYIESLFLRFDADRSGTFSVAETQTAFPIIRNLLASLSGRDDDEELLALFTYIIKYGERPDRTLWTGIKFLWWKGNKKTWKYEADRAAILKVIANLSTDD